MKRLLLLAVAAAVFTFPAGTGALADSGARSYDYLLGAGLLCSLDPSACPDIAQAPNGDTVELTGSGTLDIHAKSVTGGGAFVHKNAAGAVLASGTWTAEKLLSFHSYGTQPGFPSSFEGGQAAIEVTLVDAAGVAVHTGTLWVYCEVSAPPPAGQGEGVRLNVPGVVNFNKLVSGFTLFIRTA